MARSAAGGLLMNTQQLPALPLVSDTLGSDQHTVAAILSNQV